MMAPRMRFHAALATLLLIAAAAATGARAQAADAPVAAPPAPLQPFVATYQVFHQGRELGEATLQVVHTGGSQWRVDLGMKGRGLMRLTGLNVQQSTLFDVQGDAFRPLTQATVRRAFLSRHKTVGVYDWIARTAHWTGDVKPGRAGPVPLQDGDMSGLLIDLAVIRDAATGRQLHYRFVDDGRTRDHVWNVAPATEAVSVGDLSYDALRADRVEDGGDERGADRTGHGVAPLYSTRRRSVLSAPSSRCRMRIGVGTPSATQSVVASPPCCTRSARSAS